MAVRFDAAGDRLLRTASLPTFDTAYTWMAWVYAVALPAVGSYASLFTINNESALNEDSFEFKGTSGSNKRLVAGYGYGSYEETTGTTAIVVSTWYHVAFVSVGSTSYLCYLNGALEITESHTAHTRSGGAANRMECGDWGAGNSAPFSGRQAYMKLWNGVALTASEILQERYSIRPVTNLSSLYGWWPTFPGSGERVKDYSGTGHDWTEGGTLTDEAEPPVSWGNIPVFTGFSAGAGSTNGAAAITLEGIGVSAAGVVPIAGTSSITLGGIGLVATGISPNTGALAKTLDNIGVTASGQVAVTGALVKNLDAISLVATGTVSDVSGITGSASITLDGISPTAAGNVAVAGLSSINLAGIGINAVGITPIKGTAGIVLSGVAISAAGVIGTTPIMGSAQILLADALLQATGQVLTHGQASITLDAITLIAWGGSPGWTISGVVVVISGTIVAGEADESWAVEGCSPTGAPGAWSVNGSDVDESWSVS